MLAANVIRPSHSNYSLPVVIVAKKNADSRFCMDFRTLNERTHDESSPLLAIHEALRNLGTTFETGIGKRSRYDRKRPLRPDEIEELANRSDDSLSIEDPYSSDDSVIDETYSPKGHHVDSDEDDYSDDSEIEAEVAENATDFNQDIDPDLGWEDTDFDHLKMQVDFYGWEDTDFDHQVDFYGQPVFNINLPKDVPPIKIFEFFFWR
ncbi:hypothetical protein QE152_g27743 [Popillia japonica]|uniref:Reverse transcriptase domain-containing protein n=1 Tax=Popillia japonica TaxID=7064 RepID=A0AAW1JQT5_POPJA